MSSREEFEKEMCNEYLWFGEALELAHFHGDDATGYYTGGGYIYDGTSCAEALFWAWRGWQASKTKSQSQLTALTSQLESVVAENAASNDRLQKLIQIISNADNSYCMCGDAMENHTHGGCGHPTGMFDYHYNQWLESGKETPATDAFLAEVRASGVDLVCDYHKSRCEALRDVDRNGSQRHGAALCDAIDIAAQIRQGGAV